MIGTFRSILEGPRWLDSKNFIKNLCFLYDLEIINLDTSKGFIRQTLRIEVKGKKDNLIKLHKSIEEFVGEHNEHN